jgi:hypothetical protein
LLGQIASVSLLGWLGWQTLMLRREALPKEQQTPLPTSAEIQRLVQQQIERFTKGQKPANSTASGGSSAFAGLQQGVIGTLDKVTATVEQTIAKFKKPQTPSAKVPKAAVKTPVETPKTSSVIAAPPVQTPPATPEKVEPPATPVDVASTPKVETPPVTPEKVEPPATPVDVASTPKVETPPVTPEKVETPATPVDVASTPKVETPPATPEKKEPPATPVDVASTPDIETPSVPDALPTSETEFQSPTDEQIEEAIKQAEDEIDNPNSTPESDIPRNSA